MRMQFPFCISVGVCWDVRVAISRRGRYNRGGRARFTLEPRATATPERFRLSIALVLKHPVSIRRSLYTGPRPLPLLFIPFSLTDATVRVESRLDCHVCGGEGIRNPRRCHSRSVRSVRDFRFFVTVVRSLPRTFFI